MHWWAIQLSRGSVNTSSNLALVLYKWSYLALYLMILTNSFKIEKTNYKFTLFCCYTIKNIGQF